MKVKEFFSSIGKTIASRSLKDYVRYLLMPIIIIAAFVFFDLLTKGLIDKNMDLGDSITIIPKFLHFTYVINTGAAFSMLEGKIAFFVVVTVLVVLFVLFYLIYDCQTMHPIIKVALAMIVGGAIGNLVDRIQYRGVRDFIEIEYFGLDLPLIGRSFAIFNIADIGVTVGTILLIIGILFFIKDVSNTPKAQEETVDSVENTQQTKASSENIIIEKTDSDILEGLANTQNSQDQSEQ